MQGNCSICNTKKYSFIKTGEGIGDLLNKGIAKLGDLGVELHLPAREGEYVPNGSFNNLPKYSYCGPGTKYEQRNREGYKGINELDSMCKLHDQYYNENDDVASRNISDIALAHRAKEIASSPKYDDVQRKFANFVSNILKQKARFGLGNKSKN
jgi:hypothetical protein